eukprot:Skav211843  [mRNA]  locus=scaffold305:812908:820276:+ [translate_table: standard]
MDPATPLAPRKVCTIRQAFPLCSASGGHRSPALLPEKLLCASCRNLITKLDDEETEAWRMRPPSERQTSSAAAAAGSWTASSVSASPARAPRTAPWRRGARRGGGRPAEPREFILGTATEVLSAEQSILVLGHLGSSEEDLVQNRTIFGRVHTDTSRRRPSYLRKKYTKDRRQSDPGDGGGDDAALAPPAPRSRATSELPQLGPPRPASPPSRPSSRNGSKQRPSSRQQSKESLEVVVPPSGAWKATGVMSEVVFLEGGVGRVGCRDDLMLFAGDDAWNAVYLQPSLERIHKTIPGEQMVPQGEAPLPCCPREKLEVTY